MTAQTAKNFTPMRSDVPGARVEDGNVLFTSVTVVTAVATIAEMDPLALVEALRGRADGAVERLFDRYAPALFEYCEALLGQPEPAASALSSALLAAGGPDRPAGRPGAAGALALRARPQRMPAAGPARPRRPVRRHCRGGQPSIRPRRCGRTRAAAPPARRARTARGRHVRPSARLRRPWRGGRGGPPALARQVGRGPSATPPPNRCRSRNRPVRFRRGCASGSSPMRRCRSGRRTGARSPGRSGDRDSRCRLDRPVRARRTLLAAASMVVLVLIGLAAYSVPRGTSNESVRSSGLVRIEPTVAPAAPPASGSPPPSASVTTSRPSAAVRSTPSARPTAAPSTPPPVPRPPRRLRPCRRRRFSPAVRPHRTPGRSRAPSWVPARCASRPSRSSR